MPGLGFAYFLVGLAAALPLIVATGALVGLAAWAVAGPQHVTWRTLGACAASAAIGIAVGLAIFVMPGTGEGVPPGWIAPFNVIAAGAALVASGTMIAYRRDRPITPPLAATVLVVGAFAGFFLVPAVPALGGIAADARCRLEPTCMTPEEAEAASVPAGTARLDLELDGSSVDDHARPVACHGELRDGTFEIAGAFGQTGSLLVTAGVNVDGPYLLMNGATAAGPFIVFPGKGWQRDDALALEPGSTRSAGALSFDGVTLLFESAPDDLSTTVAGRIDWTCDA